ncbi:MAG: sulfatase-like hydrolase/transferase [Deltaproteobacteria bacterium]|uniref:Sulfatase-like hydrolase/transferase n=1 Tax=Candidatus Zymogenus saltonus TaxID=2844893 RepID=A0A9D8PRS4_9DELT|nr:sulfatase-like hydrolase/transferase [Candidatus Zymogenus saltonus]
MKRRDFIKSAGSAVISSAIGLSARAIPGCGPARFSTEPELPNVILITADNIGWKDPGCFGNRDIETPNIDRLADEGMRFTLEVVVSFN